MVAFAQGALPQAALQKEGAGRCRCITGASAFDWGDCVFPARGDDGIRVWLNNQLIVDLWGGNLPEIRVFASVPGNTSDIRVEYHEP